MGPVGAGFWGEALPNSHVTKAAASMGGSVSELQGVGFENWSTQSLRASSGMGWGSGVALCARPIPRRKS